MIRDIRYIIKKVIIGVLIALILAFINIKMTHAAVQNVAMTLENLPVTNSNYATVAAGYRTLRVTFDGYADGLLAPTDPFFVSIVFCSDNEHTNITTSNSAVSNLSLNKTQLRCFYPNSTYNRGHISIINYKLRGGGAYNNTNFVWYMNDQTSMTLVDFVVSLDSWVNINDYAGISTAFQQQEIMSQNNTIINNQNAQTTILNNVVNAVNNSSQFLQTLISNVQNVENTMKDDSIDESFQGQKISDIQGSGYSNGSISDIVLLPVTLINKVVDGLSSNSCSSFNLGSFYGSNIVLPCYTSTDVSGWLGSSVYTIVDLLMSFGVILGIRKLVLKIYNTIVFLKEGGSTID